MSAGSVFALAVGLSMDATAVAASRGFVAPIFRKREAAAYALCFGGFQALMPALGWVLGDRAGPYIAAFDHWVAFTLLALIGGKMIWESYAEAEAEATPAALSMSTLLALGVATSIDALAAGFTLPMMEVPLPAALLTIGLTTALFSAAGYVAGRRFGSALGPRLDRLGGAILILLGLRVLAQHLGGG